MTVEDEQYMPSMADGVGSEAPVTLDQLAMLAVLVVGWILWKRRTV